MRGIAPALTCLEGVESGEMQAFRSFFMTALEARLFLCCFCRFSQKLVGRSLTWLSYESSAL